VNWAPLLWLAVTLFLLALIERWIHRHLQGIALLIAGDREVAVVLYALPLLPGVLLHELSHAAAALLLGVRVGRISLRPLLSGQHIRLGVVPVQRTGPARASLIGLAPLLAGCAVILVLGYAVFDVEPARNVVGSLVLGDLAATFRRLISAQDAWVWFYVIFTVSNTMLPSSSDRRSWAPVLIFLGLAAALVFVAGYGPVVTDLLAAPVASGVDWLAAMTTLTVVADLPFIVLMVIIEQVLCRLRGATLRYGR
jgi:hypothetical protein